MQIHRTIQEDLASGEEVLWQAEPMALPMLVHRLSWSGVISGFFIGVLMCTGYMNENVVLFFYFGLLVLAISVVNAYIELWSIFAITNKRLIVLKPGIFGREINSFYPLDIDFIRKVRWRKGAGSIVFAAVREMKGKRAQTEEYGFYGVTDMDSVEKLILSLRNPKLHSLLTQE